MSYGHGSATKMQEYTVLMGGTSGMEMLWPNQVSAMTPDQTVWVQALAVLEISGCPAVQDD